MSLEPMAENRAIKQQTVRLIKRPGSKARAQKMLSRLKSYEEWISTAGPHTLSQTERESGDSRKFYDRFVEELTKIAREGEIGAIRIKTVYGR